MIKRKALTAAIAMAATSVAFAQAPQIEEISVIGQFVPDEKRGTDQVSNVVNSEEFQRTGDANVAESLKRVSGLSTVGGKFVYVRGLGERYSNTLLNGAQLPSPEPINRVVPMDLFPTAVLDSVLVQKTYSAQYPSEFGGGVLQMRTKKSNDEFFFTVTSSVGGVQGVALNESLQTSGGGTDWLGMDDGYRDQPLLLQQATANDQELRPFSRFSGDGIPLDQLEAVGESFNIQYTPERKDAPLNTDLTVATGNAWDLNDDGGKFSFLAAVDYSNGWDTDTIERNDFVPATDGGLFQREGQVFIGTENSVDVSSIITAGIDFNYNHNIRANSVLLRKTDNRANVQSGFNESSQNLRSGELEWIERELFANQLQGDHYFPDFNEMVINWRVSKIKAERDAPDRRTFLYDGGQFSSRVDGNIRDWSTLDDNQEEVGLDFTMVFYGPAESIITPKVGYVKSNKDRNSEIRRFGYAFVGALANDPDLLTQPLESILTPDTINRQGFQIREITRPTDNYEALNDLESFYGQVEFNFDERLRFTLGARQEEFSQSVNTFDLFNPDTASTAEQDSKKLLPSANLTYIAGDHQFRAAYSETVSRPDFRELSPAAFTNPVTGKEVVGNPDLLIADIKNYDLRWEWYFGFSDYMSVGLFYKEFTNPIETSVVSATLRRTTFINAATAENQGIEFEMYRRFDWLGDMFNGIGEDFYFQGNMAFIESEVSIRPEDVGVLTNETRALQGQSDWLFNAQLGYEPVTGTTATLLYHYYGDRIAEVGVEGAPDLVEQGFGELNFVFIQDLSEHWQVTAKAKNIMNERNIIAQNDEVVIGYNRGREFSFQVQYNF